MRYEGMNVEPEVLIGRRLREIEERENVRILHAVESGSRAWGFASPDSDYDVRFIYVRRREDYLRLDKRDDFIDWELNETLDINGWDLDKALRLFHRSNATLFEWAGSPVVYRTTGQWREIYRVASGYFSPKTAMYHYYGTACKNYREYLLGDQVKYKKYFYVIRPLLACSWIETHGTPPPVLFSELFSTMPEGEMKGQIQRLLEVKRRMGEGELAPRIDGLNRYIEGQLAYFKALAAGTDEPAGRGWEELNRLFLENL